MSISTATLAGRRTGFGHNEPLEGFGQAGVESDHSLQRVEECGAMINQWGPDQVPSELTLYQQQPRSDFLLAILQTTVSTLFLHNFPQTFTVLVIMRDNDQICGTLFHQRLHLVNARVSSAPCDWYNVRKWFSVRPEKTSGPCLWSGVFMKASSCILLLKQSVALRQQHLTPASQQRTVNCTVPNATPQP